MHRKIGSRIGGRVVLAAVLSLMGTAARADFVNPSFETPIVGGGSFQLFSGGADIGGWTVLGRDVLLIQNTYSEPANGINQFNAQQGLNALDLTGNGNTGPTDGVQQTVATVVGTIYQISFWVGRAGGSAPFYNAAAVVDVSIDGGPRASFTNNNVTAGSVNWQQFTTSFTATSANTTIAFLNGTAPVTAFAGLDNVSITAVVPEPRSLALLGCGLSVIFGLAWRRGQARVVAAA